MVALIFRGNHKGLPLHNSQLNLEVKHFLFLYQHDANESGAYYHAQASVSTSTGHSQNSNANYRAVELDSNAV